MLDLGEDISELVESGRLIELEIEEFEAGAHEMGDDIPDDNDADESEEGSLGRRSIQIEERHDKSSDEKTTKTSVESEENISIVRKYF
jgi:hypothetical protein